tara:strand:+ start:1238 stop:1573 length:336 start_codon:yes stop_codon:yes gene_type:complete
MEEKNNQNWKEISEDISNVTKKVKDSLGEENLVDDLKDSLFETVQGTSILLKTIVEKIEFTIKDDDIQDETKEVINKINNEIRDTLNDSGSILKNYVSDLTITEDNLFEEE